MEKKLRSAIVTDVRNICKEVGKSLKIEYNENAMDLISELVWKKLLIYGSDLEAFQKHSKRTNITTEDVKLLVRRNESLKTLVEEKTKGQVANKLDGTGPKRKRIKVTATTVTNID